MLWRNHLRKWLTAYVSIQCQVGFNYMSQMPFHSDRCAYLDFQNRIYWSSYITWLETCFKDLMSNAALYHFSSVAEINDRAGIYPPLYPAARPFAPPHNICNYDVTPDLIGPRISPHPIQKKKIGEANEEESRWESSSVQIHRKRSWIRGGFDLPSTL